MRLARFAALCAAAIAFAASSLAVAQDKASLRLNWYLGGLHVPFYYGKDKGYYAAEGIDL
ncbi:MAG: nitrate ABC transporter substrate-binding protein, partial [Casimicrobiaceae bacterium]